MNENTFKRNDNRWWTLLMVVLCAACAISPERRGPPQVNEVVVRLGDGRPDQKVTPGEPLAVRVFAADPDGHYYGTWNGALGWGRVSIETRNMTWEPETRTVTPDPLPEGSEPDYAVIARVDGVVTEQPFEIDFGAHYGPAPNRVASMQVQFDGRPRPRYLRPGHPVELTVLVTDTEGRRYALGDFDNHLELVEERISVDTDHVQWDRERGLLIPSDAERVVGDDKYRVRVVYNARPGEQPSDELTAERQFIADFVGLRGPEPSQVQRVLAEVVGTTATKVAPGTRLPIDLKVQTDEGRWLQAMSPRHKQGVPMERFVVRARNATFDATRSELVVDPVSRQLVGQEYQLQAHYDGKRRMRSQLRFEPDFVAALAPVLLTESSFTRHGADGRPGKDGADGRRGASGADVSGYERGGHGSNGHDGEHGREGGDGEPGPGIKIVAVEAVSLDGSVPLVVFVIDVDGEDPQTFVRRLDGPRLSVVSGGGRGGDGGNGGDGGRGGDGGDGWSTGDGGDGGNGGDGGPGGFGGPGGPVQLVASNQRVREHFMLRSVGGPGGASGEGGGSGRRGAKGSVATMSAVGAGLEYFQAEQRDQNFDPPPQVFGSDGTAGTKGQQSRSGDVGVNGAVQAEVNHSAHAIENSVSQKLRDVLYFASEERVP